MVVINYNMACQFLTSVEVTGCVAELLQYFRGTRGQGKITQVKQGLNVSCQY